MAHDVADYYDGPIHKANDRIGSTLNVGAILSNVEFRDPVEDDVLDPDCCSRRAGDAGDGERELLRSGWVAVEAPAEMSSVTRRYSRKEVAGPTKVPKAVHILGQP